MADYLTRLGARALSQGGPELVAPRVPSRYEAEPVDDTEPEPDPIDAPSEPSPPGRTPDSTAVRPDGKAPAAPAVGRLWGTGKTQARPPERRDVADRPPAPATVDDATRGTPAAEPASMSPLALWDVIDRLTEDEEPPRPALPTVDRRVATPDLVPAPQPLFQIPGPAPSRRLGSEPEAAPVVRVAIGRIEIRAAPAPAAPPRLASQPAAAPQLTPASDNLSAYLRGEHHRRQR